MGLFLVVIGNVVDGHVEAPCEMEIGGSWVIGFLGKCKFVYTGDNIIGNRELGPSASRNTLPSGKG